MAQLIVRNIDEDVKRRLRERAERRGKSMEAEARDILSSALAETERPSVGLGTRIAARFAGLGLDSEIEELRGEEARPADFES
jgi:plasmid stability protein